MAPKIIQQKLNSMKKSLRALEIASASTLMLSKYFLAISSIFGWWLSISGYIMTAFLNYKINLKIAASVTSGICLLSVYGLYKWTNQVIGFQIIDYIIIGISSIIAIILIIIESKNKRPYWLLQANTTITFMFAFIALGLKMDIGWYALLLGHTNNTYLYYKKEAYVISFMQIISIVIIVVTKF